MEVVFCSKCGKKMEMYFDTPLCVTCDANILFELSYVKEDMKRGK